MHKPHVPNLYEGELHVQRARRKKGAEEEIRKDVEGKTHCEKEQKTLRLAPIDYITHIESSLKKNQHNARPYERIYWERLQ